jgi:hypothetical protein
LHDGAKVKVESPKRLIDKDTGRLREHDMVLTFLEGPHELCVALECRDRSRPVGVPEVEAFWAKCQRTGISHGIIVSSKGFTKSAISKANTQNIGCLLLDEVLEKAGKGPVAVAEAMGVERNYIRDFLQGKKSSLRTEVMLDLSERFGIPFKDLVVTRKKAKSRGV